MGVSLFRIVAPHMVCGVTVEAGVVRRAAPIVAWAIGKPLSLLRGWCHKKGYRIVQV